MTALAYADFLRAATEALRVSDLPQPCHAVAVVDLEGLSDLDGILGYAAVDEIMREAGERLATALNPGDLTGVTGRHQLCCLLPDLRAEAHALLAAHKILRTLTPAFSQGDRRLILSPRVGVALNGPAVSGIGDLMRNANAALRQARLEREPVKRFAGGADDALLLNIDLSSELGRAIEAGGLSMAYQPQQNLANGKIESAEALLRWRHAQRGSISPDRIIRVAEGTELMSRLTLWVFNTALRECAEYRRAGLAMGVSINFSVDDLRDAELTELVAQGLDLWGVPAGDVTIELTETAVMEGTPGSLDTLHAFKDMGLKISMDDFGTGYSSMARLLQLPLDEIKIDMTFIRDIIGDSSHERIVDSMIGLGHRLGLSVVAEGVEDSATCSRLRTLGCDMVQGYFVGRPVPLGTFIETEVNRSRDFLQAP